MDNSLSIGTSGNYLKGIGLLFISHCAWCVGFVAYLAPINTATNEMEVEVEVSYYEGLASLTGKGLFGLLFLLLVSTMMTQFVYGTVSASYFELRQESRTYDGIVDGMCMTFFGGLVGMVSAIQMYSTLGFGS